MAQAFAALGTLVALTWPGRTVQACAGSVKPFVALEIPTCVTRLPA
ncbi:exported hypothetical protein [Cupriavidus taiwanensis]|nr:exported hypothetical protein [Cupriavidus taiwanensis]